MNYIKLLNDFRDWLMVHELPTSSIALWHSLVSINNMSGWKEQFNAPNPTLQQLTGLSAEGVRKARKKLIEAGLIEYSDGRRGVAGTYNIMLLSNQQTNESTTIQPTEESTSVGKSGGIDEVSNSVGLSVGEKLHIPKHKEVVDVVEEEKDKPNALTFYENNFGMLTPYIAEQVIAWCEDLNDEIVIAAMQVTLKNGSNNFRYAETILREWSSKKLVSLDQVRAYELQKRASKKTNTIPFPRRQEVNKADERDELLDRLKRGEFG